MLPASTVDVAKALDIKVAAAYDILHRLALGHAVTPMETGDKVKMWDKKINGREFYRLEQVIRPMLGKELTELNAVANNIVASRVALGLMIDVGRVWVHFGKVECPLNTKLSLVKLAEHDSAYRLAYRVYVTLTKGMTMAALMEDAGVNWRRANNAVQLLKRLDLVTTLNRIHTSLVLFPPSVVPTGGFFV